MDPNQLDSLARLVGSGQSRRRILKTLAGGALASVGAAIGLKSAVAAPKRSVGNSCTTNSDCASNLCVQESRTRKICQCSASSDGAACPGGVCYQDVCCTPDDLKTTCSGELCGAQINNCGQSVDCGACICSSPGSCGTFAHCPNSDCYCGETTESTLVCWADAPCYTVQACATSTDCPSGFACIDTCCGLTCWEICAGAGNTSVATVGKQTGPTGTKP